MPSYSYLVPGPLGITWNSQNLGQTKAGAIIRIDTNWEPITDDFHGSVPADWIFSGQMARVDMTLINPTIVATSNIFAALAYTLGSGQMAAAAGAVGTLASAYGKALRITLANVEYFEALLTVPVDPAELVLKATQELQLPIAFIVVPDTNNKLFSHVPAFGQ